MIIYSINGTNDYIILDGVLCLKYTDSESLKKLFSILNINYEFSPISVTCDFDASQIKALKECKAFESTPYTICCFFTLRQLLCENLKN